MSDALRYHMHDTVAAKDLLFRRLRCLANYENANKVKWAYFGRVIELKEKIFIW